MRSLRRLESAKMLIFTMLAIAGLSPGYALAGVCQTGVGIPPFLDSGADPNLLMAIDNSGSMLDMAYTDETRQCFDATYDEAHNYAGYFETDKWYVFSTPVQQIWQQNHLYTEGDLVYANGGIFRALETGTSNDPDGDDGYNISEDKLEWAPMSQAGELAAGHYDNDSFASYHNMLFKATSSGDESGGTVWDSGDVNWSLMEPYFFEALSESDARTACSGSTGTTTYTSADVCINIIDSTKEFGGFAARGNFLNWASASKFDIEKSVLTGGKYDSEANFLVSESRGCGGNGFVKQVAVADQNSVTNYLVMRVKGADSDNRVGPLGANLSSDDTTRIEIIGVSENGFDASGHCQGIIEDLNAGRPIGQNQIDNCLGVGNETGTSQAALSTTVNVCRQFSDVLYPIDTDVPSLVTTVASKCEDLYTSYGYEPASMDPEDGGYVCYGIYDNDIYPYYGEILDNDDFDRTDRVGYMGRCWNAAGDCVPKKATNDCTIDEGKDYCTYIAGEEVFKNDQYYNYKCKNLKPNDTECKNPDKNSSWELIYEGGTDCSSESVAGEWVTPWLPSNKPGDAELKCITQAMIDFCGDLKVPEVIDPSDQATTTNDTWNLPAMLIDGGALGQMGVAEPIMVMKGFIAYTPKLPENPNDINMEDDGVAPDGPRGIFYSIAENLRLGVMAFADNGSNYECAEIKRTCDDSDDDGIPNVCEDDPTGDLCNYCAERRSIEKYCPENNADGAVVKVPVARGLSVDQSGVEDWSHYLDLVNSVNETRATAWTPLAEAMYTAVGYFAQDTDFCLQFDNDEKCMSYSVSESDPIQYWCQDNHVLFITEGASTADISDKVSNFLASKTTGDGDTDDVCANGLEGSSYFDDMTWWGQHAQSLYKEQIDSHDKQGLTTHIITTGTLRTDGSGECSPDSLMTAAATNGGTTRLSGENPDDFKNNVQAVLGDIFSRASAGSAASVISSSRSGAGAVYQAIFWPKLRDKNGNEVEWVGDMHALFLSNDGALYEDTNGDGVLNPSSDLNNNGVADNGEAADGGNNPIGDDKRIVFYYSQNTGKTRACYDITNFDGQCSDDPVDPLNTGTCGDNSNCVELMDIKYLWSANQQLRLKDWEERKIYTWNDLNNNGIVDGNTSLIDGGPKRPNYNISTDEFIPFNTSDALNNPIDWDVLNNKVSNRAGNVTGDFVGSERSEWETLVIDDGSADADMEVDAMNALISWIRGRDVLADEITDNDEGRLDKALRSRRYDFMDTGFTETWKLGDIVHSTPVVVGRPAEGYHYIYRDPTYAQFAERWRHRRQTIYFGGNDGMLHAINGGYYYESIDGFCCSKLNSDKECPADEQPYSGAFTNGICLNSPNLGEELWAYIPYNLAPHLKCLTDPEYKHKYYVDQRPRIFDVQIFPEDMDNDHVGGWGTILVGSMRFGGAPVNAYEQHGVSVDNDNRVFTSAYFVMDVTNPDSPSLLGEMTMVHSDNDEYTDMNYTTSSPTLVVMKDKEGENARTSWYLIVGNGPTNIDGTNAPGEQGRIGVIPLNWLVGDLGDWTNGVPHSANTYTKVGFRIPNRAPGSTDFLKPGDPDSMIEGGRFLVPPSSESSSFVSDLITVDYDVENPGDIRHGAYYKSDAVYFGTTDGTTFSIDNDAKSWSGGGRLFRLVTKRTDSDGVERVSTPSLWGERWSGDNDTSPVRMLVDAGAPITAAPTVGYDGHNFWVYSGTGRFFDKDDKMDHKKQRFFGIKEPIETPATSGFQCQDSIFSWATLNWKNVSNVYNNQTLSRTSNPGSRGLMRTDAFLVAEEDTSLFWSMPATRRSYLRFGFCYDDDENSLTSDRCIYDAGEIAKQAGVTQPSEIYWPTTPPNEITSSDLYAYPSDNDTVHKLITFESLQDYIAGTGCTTDGYPTGIDGWYREFHDPRERNVGQSSLLGGLLVYTGYRPDDDICEPEGESFLYGIHYQTGTAWKEYVFGTHRNTEGETFVRDRIGLGLGLAPTPSMHTGEPGEGSKAFIQTSTGEIVEISQKNLPLKNVESGRSRWSDRQ